jgi:ssDNA-binding Zn-finger/Zn-ribbon topoisomerase 1
MVKAELMMVLADYEEDKKAIATTGRLVLPRCPECRLIMVKRRNRETLEEFYGCSAYPACKGSYSIEQAKRVALKQTSIEKGVNAESEKKKKDNESKTGSSSSTTNNSKRTSQGSMRRKVEGKSMTRHGLTDSGFIKIGDDGKGASSDISDLEA